jgi:hypothetical protein
MRLQAGVRALLFACTCAGVHFTMSESLRTALVSEILRRPSRSSSIIHFTMTTPNQAMQRTAPRPAFPLSIARTLSLLPRALSRAVADLVSR